LFLTACSAIYLPRLTAAIRPQEQKVCMLQTVYLVFGLSTLICYAMVLLKKPLIDLLYSPQFQASGEVLVVLVIAVIFRAVSWVYGTMILATRNSRVLLLSDLALNLCLLATTRYALDNFASLVSLSWAFVLPNLLYLVFVVEYVRKKNPLMRRRLIWPLVVLGTAPLIYLSLVYLVSDRSPWTYAWLTEGFCMVVGLAVSLAALVAYKKVVS
jgi:O-antigen/teichoic acid export membrane protein